MNLSTKQKEVVRKMREGRKVLKSTSPPYSGRYYTSGFESIRHATLSALSSAGIIEYIPFDQFYKEAILSDLGKTVNIDL